MDETGRKKLWEEYAKAKTPEIREKLILSNLKHMQVCV